MRRAGIKVFVSETIINDHLATRELFITTAEYTYRMNTVDIPRSSRRAVYYSVVFNTDAHIVARNGVLNKAIFMTANTVTKP